MPNFSSSPKTASNQKRQNIGQPFINIDCHPKEAYCLSESLENKVVVNKLGSVSLEFWFNWTQSKYKYIASIAVTGEISHICSYTVNTSCTVPINELGCLELPVSVVGKIIDDLIGTSSMEGYANNIWWRDKSMKKETADWRRSRKWGLWYSHGNNRMERKCDRR